MTGGHEPEAGAGWGAIKGCVWTCAGIALLAVLALVGWGVSLIRPYRQAVAVREVLDERYGSQEAFTPPPDGGMPADRMEAFLHVRERLTGPCARLTESLAAVERMDRFDGVEDLPERPIRWALAAIRLEPRMGALFRARNEALLEAGMGQGEYTYVFVLGYSSHLASWREEEGRVAVEDVKVHSRVRGLLIEMLRRQLAAVEAGAPGEHGDAWAEGLAEEIARLEQDPRRIPWMEELPPGIEASIAPYRERLDALWCEAAAHLELLRNEIDGMGYHTH